MQTVRERRRGAGQGRVRAIQSYNDVNFVFPTWVTTQLPIGLVGLILAAILRGGDVDDLRGARVALDRDRDRLLSPLDPPGGRRPPLPDGVSRSRPAFWGLFASVVAIFSVELGSLIEVVNRFGSFFYGSILGVFLLAIGWKRANGHGAFVGLIAGMAAVGYVSAFTDDRVPLAEHRRRRRRVRRRRGRLGSRRRLKPASSA